MHAKTAITTASWNTCLPVVLIIIGPLVPVVGLAVEGSADQRFVFHERQPEEPAKGSSYHVWVETSPAVHTELDAWIACSTGQPQVVRGAANRGRLISRDNAVEFVHDA